LSCRTLTFLSINIPARYLNYDNSKTQSIMPVKAPSILKHAEIDPEYGRLSQK